MSEQGQSFDVVADDYLRARSGYPSEMFDHICETGSLSRQSRVLDIGCGSGQATLEFVERGCRVVAVDPAQRALDLLAERSPAGVDLELEHATFEEFEPTGKFDLIACAQAFHWLDPVTAPVKIASLLNQEGRVALFWHLQDISPDTPQAELYVLSSKYFKSFPVMNPPEYGREFVDAMANVLAGSGYFQDLSVCEYPWQQSYAKDMFRALFRSASSFVRLDTDRQAQLDEELVAYLAALPGNPEIHYRTCLVEASASPGGASQHPEGDLA